MYKSHGLQRLYTVENRLRAKNGCLRYVPPITRLYFCPYRSIDWTERVRQLRLIQCKPHCDLQTQLLDMRKVSGRVIHQYQNLVQSVEQHRAIAYRN